MRALRRPVSYAVAAIATVSGVALLTAMAWAGPATAQVGSDRPALAGASGARQWASLYSGPGARDDFADSVAVSRDGSKVFVTGLSSSASGTTDFATVGYRASTGARLWASRYAGIGNAGGDASAVTVAPDGRTVFVTGTASGAGTGTDYVTIAYNASTGKRVWLSRYDGPVSSNDNANAVAVSPDGRTVYVTGSSEGGPDASAGDYATVAYSAATGAQEWVNRYNGPKNSEDIATSLAVAPNGATVYVTGSSGLNYATVAINAATGARQWVNRQTAGAASSVAVGPGGNVVYVTGTSGSDGDGTSIGTLALTAATGTRKWADSWDGAGRGGSRAGALTVSPSGHMVFVTGSAALKYATIGYDAATGARRWASEFSGPGESDSGARQVVTSGQAVYITGQAGKDVATVSYDAGTGARRWSRLFAGGGTSLAVSPATGVVFVAGFTSRKPTSRDYATIAYKG